MGEQDRIATARGMIEAFNGNKWKEMEAPLASDAVYDEIGTGRRIQGASEMVGAWKGWKEALPDAKGTITNAVTSGDTVLIEVTWEGTQDGPLPGPSGTIPPSGRRQVTPAAFVCTFEGDKIREMRHYFDMLSFLQQIGALPEPAQA